MTVTRRSRSGHLSAAALVLALSLVGCSGVGTDAAAKPAVSGAETPTPGFPPRNYPAQAWTDKGLFVGGGKDAGGGTVRYRTDAAIISVDTGAVRSLPEFPFGALFEPEAIAVDGEVLVLGPSCDDVIQPEGGEAPGCADGGYAGGVYAIAANAWRRLDLPAELAGLGPFSSGEYRVTHALGTTPTGQALFAVGAPRAERVCSFEPATETWAAVPEPGVRVDDYCLTDNGLVAVTSKYSNFGKLLDDDPALTPVAGQGYSGSSTDGFVDAQVAVYDSREVAWSFGPALEGFTFKLTDPRVDCLGTGVMVSDGVDTSRVRVYDLPRAVWTEPTPPPVLPPRGARVWTGDELVHLPALPPIRGAERSPVLAYRPASGTWRTLGGASPPLTWEALWSGSRIVGYPMPVSDPDAGVFFYDVV